MNILFPFKTSPISEYNSIIACIDMDAYYAQVEARRLGFLDSVPLGVKQWNGLVAVSYSARKFGITRFTTSEDAKALCPDIRLPHVDTYKFDENGKIALSSIDDKFKPHNRAREKISLDYYRKESKKLFSIIKANFLRVEIASIDEVFIDLTEEVNQKFKEMKFEKKWHGLVHGDSNSTLNENDEFEIKMSIGSFLIQKTRQEIFDIYQYTCSGGISYNKLLAKLASGLNKPNQQTIIIPRLMPDCIGSCNINKIRLFGGKIFQAFEKKGITKVFEALKLSKDDLQGLFDSENDVNYVFDRLRGYDEEEVKTADKLLKGLKTKVLLSQKAMGKKPAVNLTDLEICVDLITLDLFVRMNNFYDETNALPQNLTINYYDNVDLMNKTKSTEIRMFDNEDDRRNTLEKGLKELIFSINHVIFPCYMIVFSLRNFKLEKGMFSYNLTDYYKKLEQEVKKKSHEESNLENEVKKICEKCGFGIKEKDFESHMDYHFACDIDKYLNPNKKKYKSDSKINEEKNRREKEEAQKKNLNKKSKKFEEKKEINNTKIEDFFKKK